MAYCIYLRKSRADMEAEERGEGETFARHQKTLLELAKRQKLTIGETYREIVSGETIAARPMMQKLLSEVEQGLWDGVLVMEVERLARGDTIDQGIVAQAFKYSATKIITPQKNYDPSDEFDEEYFEFGLFMSRREYKTINRRLQRGRRAASSEGKYIGPFAPYGYRKQKLGGKQGYTLLPHPEQAPIARLIFTYFTEGKKQSDGSFSRLSIADICHKLKQMQIPAAKGGIWSPASVRSILQNPVYAGKIRWNSRPTLKKISGGQIKSVRPRAKECLIFPGIHPALISDTTWEKAQHYLFQKKKNPGKAQIQNPLAGLVLCGVCGKKMLRRPHQNGYPDTLLCPTSSCPTVSSSLALVEEKILLSLEQCLRQYQFSKPAPDPPRIDSEAEVCRKTLLLFDKKIKDLQKQIDNCHNLVEKGIYPAEVFSVRSCKLHAELEETISGYFDLQEKSQKLQNTPSAQVNVFTPEQVFAAYRKSNSPALKNYLLKSILEKAVYHKKNPGRWHNPPEEFILELYLRFPVQTENS